MPIYEYACPKCGEFEQRQSLSDPVLKKCPTCRSKVTKLISASAFTLKGGGWYSDAYQKKASPSPASSSGESSGSSTASTSTSTSTPSTSTATTSTPSTGSSSGSGSSSSD